MDNNIIRNAKRMAEAASKGIGADIVIVVSSSDEQAAFWQERLTGDDSLHGSGAILKKEAVVLSVSEADWNGNAGNGLGTLNGYIEAGRKASRSGLIDVPKDAGVRNMAEEMLVFSSGKSTFMFHNAGKGTRVAPLPGAEVNSKPNIKLPRMIDVTDSEGTRPEPMTILEAVLIETSIYAPSRKNRLSVFWGDQVIINEEDIDYEGKHHVEIFGELVALNEDIKSYGILIPQESGDAKQREKLSIDEVKKLLPAGSENVYRSIGSFTVSLCLLEALMNMPEHLESLESKKGKLDTDPDWWQPLTSERGEYISLMKSQDVDPENAGKEWDRMRKLWENFTSSQCFIDSSGIRFLGFKDVGKKALWWDYGQNQYFLKNLQLLIEDSMEGKAARIFFGIDQEEWIKDSEVSTEVSVDNSVIVGSKISGGNVKNCVIVDSVIEEVYAEDAVIIDSKVFDLKAYGSLCYNVVAKNINLMEGKVLAHVFIPGIKCPVEMRTDISRDGSKDWKGRNGKGEFVYDNIYTYPEISELMSGVKMREVRKVRNSFESKLKNVDCPKPSEMVKTLSSKRGIGGDEARMTIARRMLAFGDVSSFTEKSYMDFFDITGSDAAEKADKELGKLVSD